MHDWQQVFCSSPVIYITYLPKICLALSGRTKRDATLLPLSVSCYCICSAHPSRKPLGYRILSNCPKQQALPYGHVINKFLEYSGRSEEQRNWGIVTEFTKSLIKIARPLHTEEDQVYRTRQYHYSPRLIHDRYLPFLFPMGVVPLQQVSSKTVHPIGITWKYSYLHT